MRSTCQASKPDYNLLLHNHHNIVLHFLQTTFLVTFFSKLFDFKHKKDVLIRVFIAQDYNSWLSWTTYLSLLSHVHWSVKDNKTQTLLTNILSYLIWEGLKITTYYFMLLLLLVDTYTIKKFLSHFNNLERIAEIHRVK